MKASALRVTMHNGRTNRKGKAYNPSHNDRNFDVSKAPNIDPKRMALNLYWTCYGEKPFTEAEKGHPDDYRFGFLVGERAFYEENFRLFLDARNRRREKSRNELQTMDDYRTLRQSCPEETLFYLGGRNNYADPKHIAAIMQDFIKWHERKYPRVHFLNWGLHQDEQGAPHIHLRKVWTAYDEEGRLFVGQEAALMQMGIEASTGRKTKTKEGKEVEKARYNNRKVTYTAETRAKLQELAQQYGYTIEDKPRPKSKSGRELNEYIAEEKQREAAEAEQRAALAAKEERHATAAVATLTRQQQERLQKVQEQLDRLDATGWTAALDTLDEALKGFTLKSSTKEARANAAAARDAVDSIAGSIEALRAFATAAGETTEQAAAHASMQRRLTRTRNAITRAEKKQKETEETTARLDTEAANDRAEQWATFLQQMQASLARAAARQKEEADAKEKERAKEHRQKMADLDAEAERRAQAVLQGYRADVERMEKRTAALETQARAAVEERDTARAEAEKIKGETQAAKEELADLGREITNARGKLDATKNAAEAAQGELKAARDALAGALAEKPAEALLGAFLGFGGTHGLPALVDATQALQDAAQNALYAGWSDDAEGALAQRLYTAANMGADNDMTLGH